MCSYYEAASSPEYSRDPQNGAEPLDSSDEGYDYQEPIPTILAKKFTADVSNMILRKGLAHTKVSLPNCRVTQSSATEPRTIAMHCGVSTGTKM